MKKQEVVDIIRSLETQGFYADCPACDEPMKLKDCGLFYQADFTEAAKEVFQGMLEQQASWAKELEARDKNIPIVSQRGATAVNHGLIMERLAPCLDSFCFDRSDCRSMFDPIDYVIFEGLSKGSVSRLLFMEIKTGGSRLSGTQKQIQSLVESRQIEMHITDSKGSRR